MDPANSRHSLTMNTKTPANQDGTGNTSSYAQEGTLRNMPIPTGPRNAIASGFKIPTGRGIDNRFAQPSTQDDGVSMSGVQGRQEMLKSRYADHSYHGNNDYNNNWSHNSSRGRNFGLGPHHGNRGNHYGRGSRSNAPAAISSNETFHTGREEPSVFPRGIHTFNATQRAAKAREIDQRIIPALTQQYPELVSAFNNSDIVRGSGLSRAKLFEDDAARQSRRIVRLWNCESLNAAWILRREDPMADIAVLNMADQEQRGGLFLQGSSRQEESLCQMTTLYHGLRSGWYPMLIDHLQWTPDMLVFRDMNLHDLSPKEYYTVHFISCAALNRPQIKDGDYAYDEDAVIMEDKFKHIMRLAVEKKVKKVVLSALGCGVFAHPVDRIIGMMERVLIPTAGAEEDWYASGIEEIIIAVKDFDDRKNWESFSRRLARYPEGVEVDSLGRIALDRWLKTLE